LTNIYRPHFLSAIDSTYHSLLVSGGPLRFEAQGLNLGSLSKSDPVNRKCFFYKTHFVFMSISKSLTRSMGCRIGK